MTSVMTNPPSEAPARVRVWALALGFAALLAPSLAEAGVKWGGGRSGLPWASGAVGGLAEIESLRGRKLDFKTGYVSTRNWNQLVRDARWAGSLGRGGANVVIAVGLMPNSHRGQHRQCASGQFDSYIRAFGRNLVGAGEPKAVIRLGWEANRIGSFPWAVTGDGSSYKACFRRWVSILRSTPREDFTIDWNMGQRGTWSRNVDNMYPGSDVVDVIGVQNFDRCPPVRNVAAWNKKINAKANGGSPGGIGSWLRYARSKGKRLSMPEWGIGGPRDTCKKPGIDNPFFIKQMHSWFRQNARVIAYEAYFNGHGGPASKGSAKLAPTRHNPKAAAMYRKLW